MECLGTDKCNPVGEEEPLISCYGCGNSVHPSCRVYSADLVHHFQKEGWTCDDCKVCLVCGESQTNEDLIICEYCDEGVHYTCLDPPPEKRPKVWDCDDCLIERGKPPNNNVRKRNGLEGGRNLPRIPSTYQDHPIRIKVDGTSGDDSASGSGSSSDSSNESEDESEGRKRLRSNKKSSISTNTTNSFFTNSHKKSGRTPSLINSGTNSPIASNSLLSYRNNESSFKTDEEDNATGADKSAAIGLAEGKAQDSDTAQHSLIDSLINQTKQKFLPRSSKRKAEKLSKKQRKQQEKEQRMKEEQQQKLKKEGEEQNKDGIKSPNKISKAVKGKLEEKGGTELLNGTSPKDDMDEDDGKVKREENAEDKIAANEKKKKIRPLESENPRQIPALHKMQNGEDYTLKGGKVTNSASVKRNPSTRSLASIEPLDILTTSTADTNTTGASSTAGTVTTTSATDTNTDNATTTEDDDDDMPLAAKKMNSKRRGKKNKGSGQKHSTVSENDTQEEMEVATTNDKEKIKDEVVTKSPSKISKPKGLVDSLSKYFTPGGRRAVTSRTALSSLIGSASSPTRRSADSALAMIHATISANNSESLGMKRKRGSAAAFLSGSSDGEDSQYTKGGLKSAAKKSKRNKSLDSASHGPNTIEHLKKSVAGTSSAHSDSETGTGGLHDRKRHTSGGGQLRSLYDGLSHLYTDCDSRLRHIPSTNYAPEKRRKLAAEALFQEAGKHYSKWSAVTYLKLIYYSNIDLYQT